MRIGLDVSQAVGSKVGVGYYAYNLVQALARIDRTNHYILYPIFGENFYPDFKSVFRVASPRFRIMMDRIPKRAIEKLWFNPRVPREVLLGKTDVLHSTTFHVPSRWYGKLVMTVYDVSFLTHPEYHTEANRRRCLTATLRAGLYCSKVIAISENTRNDLSRFFNIPDSRLAVTYLAAGERFRPEGNPEVIANVRKKYDIPSDYILSVGTLEPRKNLGGLMQAYALLPEELRKRFCLALAGLKGWLTDAIFETGKSLKLGESLRFLGYVTEEDLPALYSGASVFVYPSFYEGFGLPVAEAMACGAPVVCSNTSSLPEVAGTAALLFDPHDARALSERMRQVLEDTELASGMREASLEQSRKFSWENTARQTLAIYEEVARSEP